MNQLIIYLDIFEVFYFCFPKNKMYDHLPSCFFLVTGSPSQQISLVTLVKTLKKTPKSGMVGFLHNFNNILYFLPHFGEIKLIEGLNLSKTCVIINSI